MILTPKADERNTKPLFDMLAHLDYGVPLDTPICPEAVSVTQAETALPPTSSILESLGTQSLWVAEQTLMQQAQAALVALYAIQQALDRQEAAAADAWAICPLCGADMRNGGEHGVTVYPATYEQPADIGCIFEDESIDDRLEDYWLTQHWGKVS